jgi:hypothetical protein
MIYGEIERTEFQRLLDQDEPTDLEHIEQFVYVIRTNDRRIHALIGARDAGQLTDQQYYSEAQQLCEAVKAGQHRLH